MSNKTEPKGRFVASLVPRASPSRGGQQHGLGRLALLFVLYTTRIWERKSLGRKKSPRRSGSPPSLGFRKILTVLSPLLLDPKRWTQDRLATFSTSDLTGDTEAGVLRVLANPLSHSDPLAGTSPNPRTSSWWSLGTSSTSRASRQTSLDGLDGAGRTTCSRAPRIPAPASAPSSGRGCFGEDRFPRHVASSPGLSRPSAAAHRASGAAGRLRQGRSSWQQKLDPRGDSGAPPAVQRSQTLPASPGRRQRRSSTCQRHTDMPRSHAAQLEGRSPCCRTCRRGSTVGCCR
eukprot:scaffold6_cov245-Pinguiococcus_pyrenoidosus.AAC.2